MNASTALARLRALKLPVIRTSEAAAVLGLSGVTAAQVLRRLARAGLVIPLRHGMVWVRDPPIDPWVVLDAIALPYPAYASLYSALSLHGVLSQLPAVHYAVTLGRTRRVRTETGTFSLHQVAPALFGGFETQASGARLATVEKALFDLSYLAGTRSRLFARPPELELPRRLDVHALEGWVARIPSARRRARVARHLDALVQGRRPATGKARAPARR